MAAKSYIGPWCISESTRWGRFHAWYSLAGLRKIVFPGVKPLHAVTSAIDAPNLVAAYHKLTSWALEAVVNGKDILVMPPLDWSGATDFQRAVWTKLLEIPRGKVWTYAELARQVGKRGAARAVGAACGANPIPVLVPCHRVVAANGRLGGYSAGVKWKRRLLKKEGHKIRDFCLVLCHDEKVL